MKKNHAEYAKFSVSAWFFFGPSGESRTHGLLNPIQARYQTALHPDIAAFSDGKNYYSGFKINCQYFFARIVNEFFFRPHIRHNFPPAYSDHSKTG